MGTQYRERVLVRPSRTASAACRQMPACAVPTLWGYPLSNQITRVTVLSSIASFVQRQCLDNKGHCLEAFKSRSILVQAVASTTA